MAASCWMRLYFYPRPPRGGRPSPMLPQPRRQRFLSTPSARRATHARRTCLRMRRISIHALREEGDGGSTPNPAIVNEFLSTPSARRATSVDLVTSGVYTISIHALREEGDTLNQTLTYVGRLFLSTPSARRATLSPAPSRPPCSHFYPRPPRGGRLTAFFSSSCILVFLSTPSARRATISEAAAPDGVSISIHALREEGDSRHKAAG